MTDPLAELMEQLESDLQDAPPKEPPSDLETKRDDLLEGSRNGTVEKSEEYIRRAKKKVIEKMYAEEEAKRRRRADEFLTDFAISKLADLLGGLNAVEAPEELSDELKRDDLLRRDVMGLVRWVSPLVPFWGILSGGITVTKHISKK